jgi:autotransporter-associated beta strand protein
VTLNGGRGSSVPLIDQEGSKDLTLTDGSGQKTLTLQLTASGDLKVGGAGALIISSAITASGQSINKTGTGTLTLSNNDTFGSLSLSGGTLTLSGTNTITNGVSVTTGTLNINSAAAIGSSTLSISGGTIDDTNAALTLSNNNAQTWNGDFTFGGTKALNLGTGAVSLGASAGTGRSLTVNGSGALTVGGVISNGTTANAITKAGAGTLTLTGNSTFSGGLTLSAGTLNINSGGASAANSAIGTGTLTINGGTIDNGKGSAITLLPNNAQVWNGDFTFTGSSALNLGSGAVSLGSATGSSRTVTVSANTLTVGGAITDGTTANNLIKAGNGTLLLSGSSTYSGATTVKAGTVKVTSVGAVASASNLGAGSTISLGSSTSAATLLYTGSGESSNKTLDLSGTTFGATVDQSGTGTLVFSADNTASGLGAKTLTLQGSTSGAGLTAGKVVDSSSGATSVVKSGTGTWGLNGNNTYSGGTTINGGLLVVNNVLANLGDSGTGSGSVTVNANASLGGGAGQANGGTLSPTTGTFLSGQIGTIAGSVTVAANGVLAPGNSVGTLTVGGLTLQTGALGSFEFNTTTSNNTTVALSNDFVQVNGNITLPTTGVASLSVYQEGTTNGYSQPGTYHLFGYTGAVQNEILDSNTPAHITNLQVSNPVTGFTYYFVDNTTTVPHTVDLVIIVTPAPQFTSLDHTTFAVGTAGTFSVTTSHPLGLNRDITESGVLPNGVTFTAGPAGSGTATISGTPTAGTGGLYTLTLTATDTANQVTQQTFTLTVNEAPTITSGSSTTFQTGTAGTFTVTTSHNYPTATIGETGALPSGVTFVDNHNGIATLSGTPGATTGGTYSLTITASNAAGSAQQTFTLTVNQPPSITSATSTTFTARSAGTFSATTAGFPKPAISSSSTLPSGVTLVDNGNGTATLSGTPAAGTGANYPIAIGATNGIGTAASQSFTLTVREVSITSASSTSFLVGSAGAFTVTTHFFSSPTNPTPTLSLKSGANTLPSGVTFVNNADGTATISGTPASGSEGAYNITIVADNGLAGQSKLTDSQDFTVNVNRAPSFTSATGATFKVGSPGNFSVQVAGFPKPTIVPTGTLPASITFTDNHNGTATISGTPLASDGGPYPLTITATNTVNQAVQSFTLTINETPIITSSASTTFQTGTAGTFTVTTGHVYPAPPAITATGALPGGVTFVDNADGTATLSGTPGANAGGSYPLAIAAKNGITPDGTQNFTLTVNQPPAITSANTAAFPVGIMTSFTVTTTGYPVNAITEPETLPSGLTFVDNGNGTATIFGTAATGSEGSHPITITAANNVTPAAVQTFTIVVNSSPVFTSAGNTTFTVGTAGTFSVTTTHNGGSDPVITITSGTLPSALQLLDNGDGTATLSGTPATGTGGTYTLGLKASNGILPDATQTFTLTVNEAPSIAATPTPSPFVTGTAGSFTITTSGFPKPTITETGTLPGGVTFVDKGDGTATVSGTPTSNAGGSYPFTINASNVVGAAAAQAFTIQVNQAAGITSGNSTTFKVGASNSFTVNASGVPTASLSVVLPSGVTSLPSGVSFVDNGNGTGTLSGNPAVGTGGVYTFSFQASNNIGIAATQSFTLAINEVSITSTDHATFKVGSAGSFTVTTHYYPTPTPIPALTLSTAVHQSGLPSGVTFTDNHDGTATIAGTPAGGTANANAYTFTITASNGVNGAGKLSSTQTFSLTVSQAPSITSVNTATFKAGTAGNFSITTNGLPAATVSKTGTLPSGLTFTPNSNGTATISGTPAAGTGGTYPLSITASNGTAPDATQTLTLTVNEAPSITSASSATFGIGSAGSFVVMTGHSYPANPLLTQTGTLPSGVTFVDNGDGTATLGGTPDANTGGSYPITIKASNTISPDATQSFTLTVNQAPSITSATSTIYTVGTSKSFSVTTTGFPKAAISQTGTLPSGLSFGDNGDGTATLSGTPASGTGGAYPLSIKAANGVGTDATQNFTLTVNEAPTINSTNAATFTAGATSSCTGTVVNCFTVTTSHSYPANPGLTEEGNLPNGVTFTDNGDGTATIAGTPAATTGGTYSLALTANNQISPNGTQTFTLTVNEAPRFTSADHKSFTVGVTCDGTPDHDCALKVTTGGYPGVTKITEAAKPNDAFGGLPAGITFTDNGDGTATIGGTPQSGTNGDWHITLTATSGISPDATQDVTITVAFGPSITSLDHTTFTAGTNASCSGTIVNCFTISTTHPSGSTPAITGTGTLPTGVTLVDNGDGTATLSGKPATATGGTYPISLTAHNDTPPDGTQAFTLTVNEAPAITSANSTTFTAGGAGTFTITTRGYPAPAITKFSGTLPSGVTLHDNGDGTASLAGTPANATGGSYIITFHAANGIGSTASQTFTLTVQQGAAITSNTSATFKVGTAGSFTVTATGNPKPSLSVTGTLPAGVTFADNGNGTGKLSGTPATGKGGVYPLTFTASNGVGTDGTQSFTLTVNEPTAITSANHHTFTVGKPETFTITAVGGYPANVNISLADQVNSPTKTGSAVLPAGLSFTANSDGTATIAGTPTTATAQPDVFFVIANNGQQTTQQFSLTVVAAPFAPLITSADTTTFTVGAAGSFAVTASASPPPVISASGNLPNGLSYSFDSSSHGGAISGTAAIGTGGTYPITVTATNGITPDATQNFTLVVHEAPSITSANSTTFAVGSNGVFSVTATGYPAPTFSVDTLPAGVTLTNNGDATATVGGTPDPGTGGVYTITITAGNGVVPDATQSFTLTVTEAQATPTPTATATATATVTPTATASPIPTPTATPTPSATVPPGRPLNISTRGNVGTGENVLIGGFIVRGSAPKKVAVRAIGPSLTALGVAGALADPMLELHSGQTTIAANDDWKTNVNAAEIVSEGLAPTVDAESVIIATLDPGPTGVASFTAIVSGKNSSFGVALVEVYDLDSSGASELANISTRGVVQPDPGVLIGGFIVGGKAGDNSTILVRAIAPSLKDSGVANALPDPTLSIHNAQGETLISNDDWANDPQQAAAITATGVPPTDSRESAIIAGFAPGNYTAVVAGKNGASGVALVEAYHIK